MRAGSQRFKSVRERDIDYLLLEELTVSAEFREWFVGELARPPGSVVKFLGAWHSVSDAELGESDVELGLLVAEETRLLVMVENKVDAPFQDEQLQRYRRRGEKATSNEWDEFRTCLFAPERYLAHVERAEEVDGTITYEAAREWFVERESDRAAFKAAMLSEGIDQNRRGYDAEPDEDVTELHRRYWRIARDRAPELGVKRPDGVPSGNLWIRFRPAALPSDTNLIHKMGRGTVDLQFSGAAERRDDFESRYVPLLEEGMAAVQTGKSMSARITVPPTSEDDDSEGQAESIRAGVIAATRLLAWYDDAV